MKHIQKILWIMLPITLLTAAFVYGGTAHNAQAAGGAISGVVASPGGYPLQPGTVVKLFDADVETVHGQATPDLGDGTFSFSLVPNGLYVLKAVPPENSEYTQSLPKAVSLVNAPVDVGEIALTEPQISGTVSAPDGSFPASAWVSVYLGDGQMLQHLHTGDGDFAIGGLPSGGYWLQASPASDDPHWHSARALVSISSPDATQTLTLTLTNADLWGIAQDEIGNPVIDAKVVALNASGEYRADRSSSSGYWAIGGLSAGNYLLAANPSWVDNGLLPPEPVTVTIPGSSNPYTLIFQNPTKIVEGLVKINSGLPVLEAQVNARRVDKHGHAKTQTASDGSYDLQLSPGLWAMSVSPVSSTIPADWVYPQPPQLVYFQQDNLPQTHTQDFTVSIADAAVIGEVEMPGGGSPPFTVTVGLHNDEGVGAHTVVEPDGSFELRLRNGGYKVIVHPESRNYLRPTLEPINIPPNSTLDLGTLTLLERNALITGTISTQGSEALMLSADDGVPGIPVVAWRAGVRSSLETVTGPDGVYALPVTSGTWHIQPAPTAEHPYLFTGAGDEITLASSEIVSDVNFRLLAADATITGVLVDEDGVPVSDAEGWAAASNTADPALHNGAPVLDGIFTIFIPAGEYKVAAHLPAGSPYMSAYEQQVTAIAGEIVTLTLTVQSKNAVIAGALWNPRNQDVVEGVPGSVGVWAGGNWAATHINTGNGTYHLDVAPGLWHLNYRIDPQAGYTKVVGTMNIPVQANQTVVVPLPIIPKDGIITGVVLAPDGSPLAGAPVHAKGITGHPLNAWFHTLSRADGSFELEVPYGRYRLGATFPDSGWMSPIEIQVNIPENGVSNAHILQFQKPDATISGMLTVTNTLEGGSVLVWGWSDEGGFVKRRFPVSPSGNGQAEGLYKLDVLSESTWHLGAVFETSTHYWFGRVEVSLGEVDVLQDLTLYGPHPKPAPVVVTFDAATPRRIELADGTQIYIPAGAMPITGKVTLRIVPLAKLPHQQHANMLKYGYAFLATDETGQPIETHFNQDVVIRFSYNEADLEALHIHERWLKPAYYATTTERWTFPESYVVDIDVNQVVMQIDHFTDFALTGSPGFVMFMPAVVR